MNRAVIPFLALLASGLAACDGGADDGAGGAEPPIVNFYNWSDYIAPATIPGFEAATGIKVNYDVFDSNDVLEGKLLAGATGYDVVVPTGAFFAVQREAGLFQPLDKAKLANYANLDPAILARVARLDPGNVYAVPYMYGTTGLGYDLNKIRARLPGAPLDSWDLIFKPENAARFADCGIAILDAPDEVQWITMHYAGFDPESGKKQEIEKAMSLIAAIRPYVRYFHSSSYIDDLANGEICLALGWSGDIFQAKNDAAPGIDIRYAVPREGTVIWFDLMAIPIDAPHPDNAHKLLDYLLGATVAATNTNHIWYPSPNRAAMAYVDEAIRSDPQIYPSPEVMARLTTDIPDPPRIVRIRNRAWTNIKAGRGNN
ncbi:MAG: polyamine ABC transporter substrate-binding protein [Pseudomonadota bacterium]